MQRIQQLKAVPDDELLRRLAALVDGSRHTEADLVAHIGEVDARELYAREAAPSMFVYCVERLHLSEAEAYLRIAAARASREHPVVLEMLADGRLHLTGIVLLAPHLTPEKRDVLLQRATHKTKREIEELVAELAPRPDVRPSIRKLPQGRVVGSTAPTERVVVPLLGFPVAPSHVAPDALAVAFELRPEQADSHRLDEVVGHGDSAPGADKAPQDCDDGPHADRDRAPAGSATVDSGRRWAARRESRPELIEPLSPARYKVQFTASAGLRDKLERLKALMRSSVPDGDLAAIIEAAVTEKLERLEARRFGRTRSPRRRLQTKPARTEPTRPMRKDSTEAMRTNATGHAPTKAAVPALRDAPSSSRHVPAEVRRAVFERDEGRCRYVDDKGRRCTARVSLEYHHRIPYAVGGEHSPTNTSLQCEAHNRLLARIDFGAKAVGWRRRTRAPASSTPE